MAVLVIALAFIIQSSVPADALSAGQQFGLLAAQSWLIIMTAWLDRKSGVPWSVLQLAAVPAFLLHLSLHWAAYTSGIDAAASPAVQNLTAGVVAVLFVALPLFAIVASPIYSLYCDMRRR